MLPTVDEGMAPCHRERPRQFRRTGMEELVTTGPCASTSAIGVTRRRVLAPELPCVSRHAPGALRWPSGIAAWAQARRQGAKQAVPQTHRPLRPHGENDLVTADAHGRIRLGNRADE
jgi:hypothetical protein